MTQSTDFDRLISSWLETSGPSGMDPAVVDLAFTAARRTPQRRGLRALVLGPPGWPTRPGWPISRSKAMTRPLVALGVAAIIAVGGLALLLRPGTQPGVVTPPSASPTPVPSPSISPQLSPDSGGPVPTELQARWMGGHRDFAEAGAGTSIVFTPSGYSMAQSNDNPNPHVTGEAVSLGDGKLQLTTSGDTLTCGSADVGLYAWILSPTGRTLTITADQDDCAQRATLVAGTWWLMACHDPRTNCLGELEAGSYASQYIAVRDDPAAPWSPQFGAVTYSVPSGWANYIEWPGVLGLTPSSDYAQMTGDDIEPAAAIEVRDTPGVVAGPCSGQPDASVAPTVAGQIAKLEQNPALVVTRPSSDPYAIDGHEGAYLDLIVKPGSTVCDVAYMVAGGDLLKVARTGRERLILLDLGDGKLAAVRIYVKDASRFDDVVGQAMSIVQSFRFK